MSIHEVSNEGSELHTVPTATEDAPLQANNIQPDPVSAPQPLQPAKTFFGLRHDPGRQGYPQPVFNDDYVARFPEDPYGQETAPNARAWRVYVEEAAAFDETMVGQSRDGLDVMLVFAGLFSAVVTSFLVQVSQNLQADFSEMSALLLHDLLVVQLSMADGTTVNVTTPSVDPAAKFDPDAIDVWINGLWVVSLVTSLVVALSAVLVKQWLHRYMTFPSGTPGLRSHVRQFRLMGLEKWRVRVIIGMLPIVMHISLMLFFAGLALFYVPLRTSLAWAVGTITVLVCILYLVSNTIPIFFPQCPYQTPLTDFIHHVCQVAPFGIQTLRHYCFVAYCSVHERAVPSRRQVFRNSAVLRGSLKSLIELESHAVLDAHYTLSVDALDWLYHTSSNPTVHTLVLQAISGLPSESRSYAVAKWSGATDMQSQRLQLAQEAFQSLEFLGQPSVVERLCRSCLFLPKVLSLEEASFDNILIGESRDWGPRRRAATWLAIYAPFLDYNGFFVRHSEVPMHPLVWEDIVRFMLESYGHDSSSFYPPSHLDECSLAHVLSLVISPPLRIGPNVSLMTGTQVVWTRLQATFWDTILEMPLLVPHDNVTVDTTSSYHRTLIAAGKLALSHVLEHRNDLDHFTIAHCHNLDLLVSVVRLITNPVATPNATPWTADFDFLFGVIRSLHEHVSPASVSEASQNLFLLCLHNIRSFYLWSSRIPVFHFPCLDFILHTWPNFHDCTQYDSDFAFTRLSELGIPMDIMGNALRHGREEAYRIYLDEGWMATVFTHWAICGGMGTSIEQVIGGYIQGVHTLTSNPNRRKFCEHLHQPQQLTLAFMLLVAAGAARREFSDSLRGIVVQLAKICPTHTLWKDCDTALRAILVWAQRPNLDTDLFPWPPTLQSLCTTAAFQKYPLVEWVARRISSRYVQNHWEAALETLHTVLENAECVDGVLMPDLEN